jgi:hypothetical protein
MAARPGGTARAGRIAWWGVIAVSALVLIYGLVLFFNGPDMVLTNISERTTLGPDDFRVGSPSALDVMSVVVRQAASFTAAVGFMGLIAGWRGYRSGSRWAWWAMWGVAAAIAGTGLGFVLAGAVAQTVTFLGLAALTSVALLVASRETAVR